MPKTWSSATGSASRTCAVAPTRRAPVREERSRSPELGRRAGPGPTPNADKLFPTPPVRRGPHADPPPSEAESDSGDETVMDDSDSADAEEILGPEPNMQTTTDESDSADAEEISRPEPYTHLTYEDSSTASGTESETEDSSSEPEPGEADASTQPDDQENLSFTRGPTAPQTDAFDAHYDEDWQNAEYDADSEVPSDVEPDPPLASGTRVVSRPLASTGLVWTGNFGPRDDPQQAPMRAPPVPASIRGEIQARHPPRRTGYDPYVSQEPGFDRYIARRHTRFF